jgi:phage terminase large subunit-like protein
MSTSLAHRLALLPTDDRATILSAVSEKEAAFYLYDWEGVWARSEQLPPDGDWTIWLLLAGRGFGKTLTGSQWVRKRVESGIARRIALVAPTSADVRDIVAEGTSGIMSVFPPHQRPIYEPSKRRITFHTGAIATTYSADEPDRIRGGNFDTAWCDELSSYRYPDAFDMLMFGLRVGPQPRCLVTTTPKPTRLVRDLLSRDGKDVVATRGSTYANADNLSPTFLDQIVKRYAGTRLSRQEIMGELLLDVPGALWNLAMFDERRPAPDLKRVVVAIDPAASTNEDSDETGIIVCGQGVDNDWYVLADRSGSFAPHEWAKRAIAAYDEFQADRIVAEVNNGGDMVESTLRTVRKSIPYKKVHASRGKAIRAEPIASLYAQGHVWHTRAFDALEDQLVNWTPDSGDSPDRLDALVWAMTELSSKREITIYRG